MIAQYIFLIIFALITIRLEFLKKDSEWRQFQIFFIGFWMTITFFSYISLNNLNKDLKCPEYKLIGDDIYRKIDK